jgi:hypothetical protein
LFNPCNICICFLVKCVCMCVCLCVYNIVSYYVISTVTQQREKSCNNLKQERSVFECLEFCFNIRKNTTCWHSFWARRSNNENKFYLFVIATSVASSQVVCPSLSHVRTGTFSFRRAVSFIAYEITVQRTLQFTN